MFRLLFIRLLGLVCLCIRLCYNPAAGCRTNKPYIINLLLYTSLVVIVTFCLQFEQYLAYCTKGSFVSIFSHHLLNIFQIAKRNAASK